MEQRTEKEIKTRDYIYRQLIDKSAKNWKRISFNDFGVEYSKDFQERMKNAKPIRLE